MKLWSGRKRLDETKQPHPPTIKQIRGHNYEGLNEEENYLYSGGSHGITCGYVCPMEAAWPRRDAKRARGANLIARLSTEAEPGEGESASGNAVENRNRDGSGLGGGQREAETARVGIPVKIRLQRRQTAPGKTRVAKQRRARIANCDCEQPVRAHAIVSNSAHDCEQPGACAPAAHSSGARAPN